MADGGGLAGRRRMEDQRKASELKRLGVERRQARCPVCYAIVNADMLREGMSRHRCDVRPRRR
jgi:hypothetical protein